MKFIDGIRNGDTLFAQGYRAVNPDLLATLGNQPQANDKADSGDIVINFRPKAPAKLVKPEPKNIVIIRTSGKSY